MTSIVGPTTYNYNNTTTNATTATTNNVDVTATISVASDLLVVLPLSVLGIVGNLITFVVLKRQRPRLTSSVILRAVVLTDTLLLAGAFITSSQNIARLCLFARNHGNREDGAAEGYEPIFAFVDDLVIRPAMLLLKLLDMWLTVLLTIDRFLLVIIIVDNYSIKSLV